MYAKLLLIIQMHTRTHRAEDIISAKCQEKSGKCQGTGAKSQLQFFAAFSTQPWLTSGGWRNAFHNLLQVFPIAAEQRTS